jgi:hypothetical protein
MHSVSGSNDPLREGPTAKCCQIHACISAVRLRSVNTRQRRIGMTAAFWLSSERVQPVSQGSRSAAWPLPLS